MWGSNGLCWSKGRWGSEGPSDWRIDDPSDWWSRELINWGIEDPFDRKIDKAGTMSPCDLVHEMIFCFRSMDLPNNFINKSSSFCKSRLVGDGKIGSEIEAVLLLRLRKEKVFFAAEVG